MQTQSDIREMLEAAGLSPRKRFGQHFLIDGNLMRSLLELAEDLLTRSIVGYE